MITKTQRAIEAHEKAARAHDAAAFVNDLEPIRENPESPEFPKTQEEANSDTITEIAEELSEAALLATADAMEEDVEDPTSEAGLAAQEAESEAQTALHRRNDEASDANKAAAAAHRRAVEALKK